MIDESPGFWCLTNELHRYPVRIRGIPASAVSHWEPPGRILWHLTMNP